WIRGDGCHGVTRHLDLGNDRDEARLRVRDRLAYIVLRVVAAMPLAVERPLRAIARGTADDRLLAPRADGGQLRVLLDLDAPALVLGEVPVEGVHLVEREQIDVLLDEAERHEVASGVEVSAPPGKTRRVLDRRGGHGPRLPGNRRLAKNLGRQQ